jgi:hypothetical protein
LPAERVNGRTRRRAGGRSASDEAVLILRSLLANGDFDRYWTYL